MRSLKESSPIMLVIWTLLLAGALIALVFAQWSLAFVSLATLVLALVPPMLASRWSLTLPLPFLLATTLFIFASVFLGEALEFYDRFWWWDIALHTFSSIGFGLLGFLFVFMLFDGDRFAAPPSAVALIAFCMAMTIGAIWEIFEFLMDQSFGLNMQKSGLLDTMGDLIINGFGGAVASLTGYLYLKRDSAGFLGHGLSQFITLNKRLYQKSKDRLKK